jgi:hypothetical protein
VPVCPCVPQIMEMKILDAGFFSCQIERSAIYICGVRACISCEYCLDRDFGKATVKSMPSETLNGPRSWLCSITAGFIFYPSTGG